MSKIMTIRPPDELREFIKSFAKSKGFTVNQLVLDILWRWKDNQEAS